MKIGGPREQIVLAMLALRAGHVVSVDQLIDVVWGDDPPATARGQIQSSVSALRKLFNRACRPNVIRTRTAGYQLEVADDDLDSARFGTLTATAHRDAAHGRAEAAAETLREALALWRGPAADGVHSDVVRNMAAVLEEDRLTAAEELTRLELDLGRHADVIGDLQALLGEHPWRERLYGFLMIALYRSGRQAEALEIYRRARAVLADAGIEPGQELRDLERAVLRGDPSLDPPPVEPVVKEQAVIPRQLPSSIADFVGRADAIAEITRILADHESQPVRYAVPIVAISGRGGVGKSTLALRAAHELGGRFPDGHIYVDLHGPCGDEGPATLLARFLRTLGVPGSLVPDGVAERVEMYRSRLADKRLLLVLDDASGEEQVLPLLPGGPTCALIVTSRSRMSGLPGAHWIDIDTFDHTTSTELLARIVGMDRLRAEPEATAEVVHYCGGLPLALRIAGARLVSRPHWRIGELARRLRNEVRRLDELSHQGLAIRPSIALTYRGLPDSAQRLFRLFAVIGIPDFPGWLAAALLNTGAAEADDVLDRLVLAQMVDAVRGTDGRIRYRLHDLVRVYAAERLAATETDSERRAALERMLGAWLALAELAHRKEHGGDYTIVHGTAPRVYLPEWADDDPIGSPMDWLENERAGLMSAIRQAAAAKLDELCWDLALTAVSLFEVRGHLDDWRESAELAYATAVRAGNRLGTAAMLYSCGSLNVFRKQLAAAERMFAEALEIFTAEAHTHGEALVLRDMAIVDRLRGDYGAMSARYGASLAKMRAVGDVIGEASILSSLAKFHIDEGDLDEAGSLLSTARELCRRVNFRRGEAHVSFRLAELYRKTGQPALARQALSDVLRTVRETGDRPGEAHALYCIGMVRRDEGRLDGAEATLAHALDLAVRIGDRMLEGQAHYALGEIAVARLTYQSAMRHLERARDLFDRIGSVPWLATSHLLLSEVLDATGHTARARQALERAHELLSGLDSKQSARLLSQLAQIRALLPGDDVPGR